MKLLKTKVNKILFSLITSTILFPGTALATWDSIGIGGHFSNRTIPYAISTDVSSEWTNAAVSAAKTWDSETVVSLPRSNQNKVIVYAYNYGYNGTYGQAYLNPGFFASTFTSGNIQFNTFYDYGSDYRVFVAKHEFGHILSLDDVDHYDTMYDGYSLLPTPAALVDDLLPEILGSDDITGVNTIYKKVPT